MPQLGDRLVQTLRVEFDKCFTSGSRHSFREFISSLHRRPPLCLDRRRDRLRLLHLRPPRSPMSLLKSTQSDRIRA